MCRELGSFPTNKVTLGCFVGMSRRFCAGNSVIFRQNRSREGRFVGIGGRFCAGSTRFFRQNSSHGNVLSEKAGCFVPRTPGFSDKTGREEAFCRNEWVLLRWELCNIPTKQVARRRFVGMSGCFCAGSSEVFRQNRSR